MANHELSVPTLLEQTKTAPRGPPPSQKHSTPCRAYARTASSVGRMVASASLSAFAFREVTDPKASSTDGRALEQMHKLLQAQEPERFAVRGGALATDEPPSTTPLLLLGIMSGNEERRRMLRCTWTRSSGALRRIRTLFVVGVQQPLQSQWEEASQVMELRVNISEGVRVWRPPQTNGPQRKHQAFTGTFSTYFKQAAFLQYAATQPEPLIGRADDDVFISPHMLLAYATLLQRSPHPFYGGVFEWISWRASRLEATAFSYGLAEARGRAKAPHRNCSRAAPDAESDAYDHFCVGPFAYAKGPLLMMNQAALRWLVGAKVFRRDLQRAWDMVEGRAPTRKGRIDDDINLGFWMVRMPGLHVLRLRRVVWKDTWGGGADPAMLLAAHKMPWQLHAEVLNLTSTMWETAPAVRVAALCRSEAPPCTACSHARSQRPCTLEVGLETSLQASPCIRAPKRGMGCPLFARESHPKGLAMC
jgi:hypothetical protein